MIRPMTALIALTLSLSALLATATAPAVLAAVDTLTVTSTSDTGSPCTSLPSSGSSVTEPSLRCAISVANGAPAADAKTIAFDIEPVAGTRCTTCIIDVTTAISGGANLVVSNANVTIDGTTQTTGSTVAVILQGPTTLANCGTLSPDQAGDGLVLQGAGDAVYGLSVVRFCNAGIVVEGPGTTSTETVEGCLAGIEPDGTVLGNGNLGITTGEGNQVVTIGAPGTFATGMSKGNVISGNLGAGLYVYDSLSPAGTPSVIRNNRIGTNLAGTAALSGGVSTANGGSGIEVDASHDLSILNNLVSGGSSAGITLRGSFNLTIEGNRIGTDVTGNAALGNSGDGILMTTYSDTLFPTTQYPHDITIGAAGGAAASNSNVISANGQDGIELIEGTTSTDVPHVTNITIANNLIGTGADGTTKLGNAVYGIYIHLTPPARQSRQWRLRPRAIGTAGGSSGNANVIANNGFSGVKIGLSASDPAQLTLSQNLIHDNVTSGPGNGDEIELAGQATSSCTTGFGTGKPDQYLPCPLIDTPSGGSVTVHTCAGCTVELFKAFAAANDGSSGGSVKFLGSKTAAGTACTSSCSNSTTVTFTGITDSPLTATATNPAAGETSEFAQDVNNPTFARVLRFTARRFGKVERFVWLLASNAGVADFTLTSGGQALTRRPIPVHARTAYRFTTPRPGSGPYALQVLLTNGGQLAVRPSG